MPAAICAHSLRCCAIRSLGNTRRPACAAWICDDRAGENSHNTLTYRQLRIFTSTRSYEKTYNLAGSKSKSYHRIILIFCRLHSNIITLALARSSKNSTSLYRAADEKKVDNLAAIHPYYICSIKTTDLRCLSSSQQLQERYRELRSRHASCRGARMKRREKPTPQVFPVALHSGNQ